MFSFDRRTIYFILAILIGISLLQLGMNGLILKLITIPGVLLAIGFHEFAHAWMAARLGDDTPQLQGRLTLDPLKHTDPIGILMLLFVGIGWGRPVEINSNNFKPKYSHNGEALVALAGPVANFILSIFLAFILGFYIKFTSNGFLNTTPGEVIFTMIEYSILLNIGLGIFNLIPLPPLDGSKIFIRFMPYYIRNWIYNNERWFYIAFLVLWVTNLASAIVIPIRDLIYNFIIILIQQVLQI